MSEAGPFYEVKAEDEDGFWGDTKHTVCRGDAELLHFLAHNPHRVVTLRRTDEHPWVTHYVEEKAIQVSTKERWPPL